MPNAMPEMTPTEDTSTSNIRWYGLVGGPLLALLMLVIVPEQTIQPNGDTLVLGMAGKVTAGLAIWMAVWWLTEAISIYATALLPLAVLPLTGAQSIKASAGAYAHPLIFLFLGGFILALALERWHLHKRFALFVLRLVGTSPRRLVGGFMISAAIMSMWITNTATTIVMLPIALSVIAMESDDSPHKQRFAICLLLGIAYAASIGGIGTIVGTTPNMFAVSFIENELGQTISFAEWMLIGVPLVVVFIPITWLLLTRFIFRLPATSADSDFKLDTTAEPWNRGSVLTLIIFALTAFGWMARPLLVKLPALTHLSDAGIAIGAALLLFAIPENIKEKRFLIDWETAVKVPWGVLLILGGGLCLAGSIRANGVAELLAIQLNCHRRRAATGYDTDDRQPDDLPHRTHQQCRHHHRTHTHCRRHCHRTGYRAFKTRHPRHHGRQLRLYATGGDSTQCYCFWFGHDSYTRHGQGRNMA